MSTSFVGRRVPAATLRVRREPLRLPLLLLLFWWLLKLAGAAAAGHCRVPGGRDHPDRSDADVGGLPAGPPAVRGGRLPGVGRGAGRHPAPVAGFFERWIRLPLRSRWRRWSMASRTVAVIIVGVRTIGSAGPPCGRTRPAWRRRTVSLIQTPTRR